MKFKIRLKIAYDMCMKQLLTFRVSTVLFAVVLILSGIIIYQYRAGFDYRLMVEKGFSKPLYQVYYLISDLYSSSDDEYTFPDLSHIEGISNVYKHQNSINTCECLQFLKSINLNQYQGDEGIEEVWMFASDFDLYNIVLTEGKEPNKIEVRDSILLYLSDEYRSIVTLGECFEAGNIKYCVAGFFSSDSAIPQDNVTSGNMDGIISLKYGVIEICSINNYDGYFYIKDGYDANQVIKQIQDEYNKSNSIATITNVDKALTFMEKNVYKSLKYLVIATILLAGTSIIVLLIIQIGNILTRGKEYGIWLICNATDRDIVEILILQNFIRFIYAEAIAFLFVNLITRKILYRENFVVTDITHRISNKIIAVNIYPVILGIGLFITVITVLLPAIKLSRTEPAKLIKGEL